MKKSNLYQIASFFGAIFTGVLLVISSESGFWLGFVFAFALAVGSIVIMKEGADEYYYETRDEMSGFEHEPEQTEIVFTLEDNEQDEQ